MKIRYLKLRRSLFLFFIFISFFFGPGEGGFLSTSAFSQPQEKTIREKEVISQEELNASPDTLLKKRSQGTAALLWTTLKMLVVLLLVCALAVLILRWFLPRLGGLQVRQGDIVQVMRRFPLDQRKALYLVRVAEEYHLLGVSEHSINHLMPISPEKVKEMIQKGPNLKQKGNFLDLFQGKLTSLGKTNPSIENVNLKND